MKSIATYLNLCVFFGVRFGLRRVLRGLLLFETNFEVFDEAFLLLDLLLTF